MEALSREMERVLNMADELGMALDFPGEIQTALDFPDDMEQMLHPPARSYVRNTKAFLRTPADIYEHPDSYSFVIDMPGLEPDMIKVNIEDGEVLHVVGKRRKKQAGEGEAKAKTEGETTVEGEGMRKPEAEGRAKEKAEAAEAKTGAAAKPIRIERRRTRYMRRFNLPKDADRENVRATYRNGVLTVVVGKVPAKEEASKPRSVSIPVS